MLRTSVRFSIKRWLLVGIFTSYVTVGACSDVKGTMVPDLYDATVESQTQTDEERQALLKLGLIQVIERMSGETQVQRYPQVKHALENVPDFVEQYAYQGSMLCIKYSPDLINRLIHEIGHTVWGQRRPKVLLWLALEDQQQRRLVGQETDPELQTQLLAIAKQRGLPLLLPLMDLEDVSAVTVTDVWGQFSSVLLQASERYGAQIILAGCVSHKTQTEGKPWVSHWQLLTQADKPTWEAQGQSLEEVLAQGISGSAHYLKGRYGVKNEVSSASKGQPFLIGIEDIKSAADFAKVEHYLKNLDPVRSLNISQVVGDLAIFEITPQASNGREALEQALALDHRLVVTTTETTLDPGVVDLDLRYRWIS